MAAQSAILGCHHTAGMGLDRFSSSVRLQEKAPQVSWDRRCNPDKQLCEEHGAVPDPPSTEKHMASPWSSPGKAPYGMIVTEQTPPTLSDTRPKDRAIWRLLPMEGNKSQGQVVQGPTARQCESASLLHTELVCGGHITTCAPKSPATSRLRLT